MFRICLYAFLALVVATFLVTAGEALQRRACHGAGDPVMDRLVQEGWY